MQIKYKYKKVRVIIKIKICTRFVLKNQKNEIQIQNSSLRGSKSVTVLEKMLKGFKKVKVPACPQQRSLWSGKW